ncbi:MAG: nucleotidyltransferase domain-containing protein [bacterium]
MQKILSDSVKVFYPKLTKAEVIQILKDRLEDLYKKLPITKVVLFGSYAKGNYTVGSDIDILIIYRGKKQVDDYVLVKKLLDLPRLEPHIYTMEEYEQMRDVIQKMIKDGLEL